MLSVGYMQGRLSDVVDGKIQSFPINTWEQEIVLGSNNQLNLIEWTLDHDGLSKNPLLTGSGQKKIKKILNTHGCKVSSVTADCFMQFPFWKLEKKFEEKFTKNFFSVLSACKKMDIKILVLPCVDNSSIDDSYEENRFIDYFHEKKDLLTSFKVDIAIESNFSPKKLKNFIQKLPKNSFYINDDIGNSASLGFNPEEEITEYSSLIKNVHVKDRVLNGTTVPLGEGNADFNSVIKCLAEANYRGNFILQTARDSKSQHLQALLKYKKFIESKLISYYKK